MIKNININLNYISPNNILIINNDSFSYKIELQN